MKTVLLKTITENPWKEKIYGMWIIQAFDDSGKSLSVKVIAGEKKVKSGGEVWYVGKGMSPKDFQTLKPHYAEFLEIAKNPPALPVPGGTEKIEGIEEVDF